MKIAAVFLTVLLIFNVEVDGDGLKYLRRDGKQRGKQCEQIGCKGVYVALSTNVKSISTLRWCIPSEEEARTFCRQEYKEVEKEDAEGFCYYTNNTSLGCRKFKPLPDVVAVFDTRKLLGKR